MTESATLAAIRFKLGRLPNVRLFRNQVMKCWIGTPVVARNSMTITMQAGDVLLRQARRVSAGIPGPGGSDFLGWVTQNGIARFAAVEVKTDTGRVSPEQENFLRVVAEAGGICGVARTVADAERIVAGAVT